MPNNDAFDICIIGSGPAGAFSTKILANGGKSVAVLECGGVDVNTDAGEILDSKASNFTSKNDITFSQQIGGTGYS